MADCLGVRSITHWLRQRRYSCRAGSSSHPPPRRPTRTYPNPIIWSIWEDILRERSRIFVRFEHECQGGSWRGLSIHSHQRDGSAYHRGVDAWDGRQRSPSQIVARREGEGAVCDAASSQREALNNDINIAHAQRGVDITVRQRAQTRVHGGWSQIV
jgi:hypothetical protein